MKFIYKYKTDNTFFYYFALCKIFQSIKYDLSESVKYVKMVLSEVIEMKKKICTFSKNIL